MKVSEAIAMIRDRVNDPDERVFTDAELLRYINAGIVTVGNQMIVAGNPWCIKKTTLAEGVAADIPSDFHSLLPGQPCSLSGEELLLLSDEESVDIRYFSVPSPLSTAGGADPDIPFPYPYSTNVVNVAFEMAAMRTGHDVSQERQFHLVSSGIGGAPGVEKGQP